MIRFAALVACISIVLALSARGGELPASATLQAGIGVTDITPTDSVVLAGSPTTLKSSSIESRLYVKALLLAAGDQKVAIVSLDTLKYPVEHVNRARQQIEKATGIPANNIILCASHTHRGPLWSYYKDQLVTPITKAVTIAAHNLQPCTLAKSRGKADGISECRRVIKDGKAWNRWQLPAAEVNAYPPEGPYDPEFDMLAVIGADGKYKTIVYNFASHASNTRALAVSADFPGDVHEFVQKKLGYEMQTMFLAGACGDQRPVVSIKKEVFGETLGGEIIRCLDHLEPISKPTLTVEAREMKMPGRESPEFKGEDVQLKWPKQFEHYKKTFEDMKSREKPTYQFFMTGIRIGDDFAIVTNPNELFCQFGINVKKQSPFKHTMVAELTNGAHGYVPTPKAFEGGSYETWFGEHSYLTVKAGPMIEEQSLDILSRLKTGK